MFENEKHTLTVHLATTAMDSRVFIDDIDVTRLVRKVSVEAEAMDVTRVKLEMIGRVMVDITKMPCRLQLNDAGEIEIVGIDESNYPGGELDDAVESGKEEQNVNVPNDR